MMTKRLIVPVAALVLVLGGYLVWETSTQRTVVVQGEVEATRIDIAARVTGRVVNTPFDFGDHVTAGQEIVRLESPQLKSGLASAKAALAVAKANRDLSFSTRPETIAARRAELSRAEADSDYSQKNYDRILRLRETAVRSEAELEQASNKLTVSLRTREAAAADLELAINGNSTEQKAVATAQVEQAAANLTQTEADIAELSIRAPISGEVTSRPAEIGKLFSAGAPLISIVDIENAWLTFNLREDFLDGLHIGQELQVSIPALGHRAIAVRITAINAEGSYANWRATKATGDFDLRTFSVRAKPVALVEGLRPGMSAILKWGRS